MSDALTTRLVQRAGRPAFAGNATIGERYIPALTITDPDVADAWFERLVDWVMLFGFARDAAETEAREELAYIAGFYDAETQERVSRLFGCARPAHRMEQTA